MPRTPATALVWTAAARADLIRLRRFIDPHNPAAARRAAEAIAEGAKFGQRGYVLRYRQDGQTVVVLRVWHGLEQREAPR